jgi:Uma2 family endonuclease
MVTYNNLAEQTQPSLPARGTDAVDLPPLENGDHLTRAEFERRYEAMPRLKKAELIEGVVYMPSPVHNLHSWAHGQVIGWLASYCAATARVQLNDNATVRLDIDNEVQPDGLLRLDETRGGNCRVTADDYLEGPPELIVEIAGSSATYDLHDKLNVYRRNGVQEYIVWQVYDRRLDWFWLQEEKYLPLSPDDQGLIRSQIFPGLILAVTALLEGDLQTVLAELNRGLASPEHAAFVAQLSKKNDESMAPE